MAKADHTGVPVFLTSDRLASLSDTMFGVAMTLVVTTLLPSIQAHRTSVLDIVRDMNGEIITVVLSFAISARYWVAQQQRLALTATVTPIQTWLNLTFLFLIVLVPITTSLPGLAGASVTRATVMIYGTHLFLIALVNLLLWLGVHRTVASHRQIMRTSLVMAVLSVALVVGALRPDLALYVWFVALGAPQMARYLKA